MKKVSKIKVALVHDYLNEFGGAERVLMALSEMFPEAPIFTSFYRKDSRAYEAFKDKDIRVSWVHYIPFFATKLHSPLRFLAPLIWNRLDFTNYDIIISSASWYITKGFTKKGKNTKEICYCHTPPRWLYGYQTSVEWQRYRLISWYGLIVGHFMRIYDFNAAQRVDQFLANSKNTAQRITKFYRRGSKVIYPPVELVTKPKKISQKDKIYYLVLSRLVGGKGLSLAIEAAKKLKVRLKIAGKPAGYSTEYKKLLFLANKNIEFLGFVPDEDLANLYTGAKAFLALARDEDFGITPVEAMLAGTPVIAYKGGGYLESVQEGVNGMFFDELSVGSLVKVMKKFEKKRFSDAKIKKSVEKFGKERFQKEIMQKVESMKKILKN